MDLHHPLIESVVLPFVVVFAITGLVLSVRRGQGVAWLASSSVGIGFLLAIYLLVDGLEWPPRTAVQKSPYVVAGLVLLGIVLEYRPTGRPAFMPAATLCLVLVLLWLAWPQLAQAPTMVFWALGLLVPAGVIVLGLVFSAAREPDVKAPLMLALAALGVSGAAFNAGSLVLLQMALALAAAIGGFLLWNWPRSRLAFGPGGMLAGAVGLLSTIMMLLMLSGMRPWAMAPLLAVFFTARVARRLPVPARLDREAVEAVYVVVLSLPAVVAAVLLAVSAPPDGDLYYY